MPIKPRVAVSAVSRKQPPTNSSATSKLVLIFAITLVGLNLRAPLLGVGPIIDSLQQSLDLSATMLGALITLPILGFGVFAPLAPKLLRFQPAPRLILINLLVLIAGISLRSVLGAFGLFAGTILIGMSISVIMVLLPSIMKQQFPSQAASMMGLYTTAMALGSAFAAAITVPLAQLPGSNWRWSLAFWAIPALIAAIIWWPQTSGPQHLQNRAQLRIPKLRTNWLAWQVTLFMGTQAAIAYCIFGWLPLILTDRGLSATNAGFVLAAIITAQLITSIGGPWLATRGRDQRPAILAMMILVFVGLMGLLYGAISSIYIWSAIFGLGFGGMFSIAMALLVLRSPTSQVAAAVSGMAQGVGYTMAAIAPLIIGLLHEYSNNWHSTIVFLVLLIVSATYTGLLAGRALYIKVD